MCVIFMSLRGVNVDLINLFVRKVAATYSDNPMLANNRPALAKIILLSNGSSLCVRNGWNLYIKNKHTNVCIPKSKFAIYFGFTYMIPRKAAAYNR